MGTCVYAHTTPSPTKKFHELRFQRPLGRRTIWVRASLLSSGPTPIQKDGALQPVRQQVTAFAPATIANLGPGFDWLGCAVDVSGLVPAALFLEI
jgi:hypothetical protein